MSINSQTFASAQSAILHANTQFVDAFTTYNANGIAAHYTQRGKLVVSQSNPITGRLAIGAFWQGMLDMGLCCTERTTVELEVELESAASLGNEIGTYVLSLRDGQLADQGMYVALWQWIEGCWRIRYELWHSHRL